MQCDMPEIVKNLAYASETGDISSTTIFTPSASGLYRISVYGELSNASSSNTSNITVDWTDDLNSNSETLSLSAPGTLFKSTVLLVRLAASQNVSFSTATNIVSGSYSVYITIEDMN